LYYKGREPRNFLRWIPVAQKELSGHPSAAPEHSKKEAGRMI